MLSSKFACPVSGFTIEEIEPRLFSFNSPHGACPACDGLGRRLYMDPDLVVPDPEKSLYDGAIEPWSNSSSTYYLQTLDGIAKHFRESLRTPWAELPEAMRELILNGSGETAIELSYDDGLRRYGTARPFEGVLPNLQRRWRETDSAWLKEELGRYLGSAPCEACDGHRLKPEALAVKVAGRHIGEVTGLGIEAAAGWFEALPEQLSAKQNEIASRILKEINERLGFLGNVGLGYLTLARDSGSLSGGESQRIRLASQIGSGLTGVLYVLDEPSIGLHQRDNHRLLATLKNLRDLGNTVIVVEHDEDAIREADHVVDMGPGAGVHGGIVVAEGTPAAVMAAPESLTGQYLTGRRQIPLPLARRKAKRGRWLTLAGARENNLKDIEAAIPLGTFTCVTGVSGSGKSTLVLDTLYPALAKRLTKARLHPGAHERVDGLEFIDKVVDIDQSPIGRTPRSNPATYTGCFTPIRDWFAGLPEAKARGYRPGPLLVQRQGRALRGLPGRRPDQDRDALPAGRVRHLRRLPRPALQPRDPRGQVQGQSIADALDMTVETAAEFFHAIPPVRHKLETLQKVGLGYITLGQSATTLSGGEAQRVKLAKELSRRATGDTLYILDEPTTGLHFEDVQEAPRGAARPGRAGQHGGRDRAQSRGHQDRRSRHRPRPRGRRRRRPDRRHRHARGDRADPRLLHRRLSRSRPRAAPRGRQTKRVTRRELRGLRAYPARMIWTSARRTGRS